MEGGQGARQQAAVLRVLEEKPIFYRDGKKAVVGVVEHGAVVHAVHLKALLGDKLRAVQQLDEVEGLLGMGRVGVDGSVESHRGSDAPLWIGNGKDSVLHVLSGKAHQLVSADGSAALVQGRRLGISLVLKRRKSIRLFYCLLQGVLGDQ